MGNTKKISLNLDCSTSQALLVCPYGWCWPTVVVVFLRLTRIWESCSGTWRFRQWLMFPEPFRIIFNLFWTQMHDTKCLPWIWAVRTKIVQFQADFLQSLLWSISDLYRRHSGGSSLWLEKAGHSWEVVLVWLDSCRWLVPSWWFLSSSWLAIVEGSSFNSLQVMMHGFGRLLTSSWFLRINADILWHLRINADILWHPLTYIFESRAKTVHFGITHIAGGWFGCHQFGIFPY